MSFLSDTTYEYQTKRFGYEINAGYIYSIPNLNGLSNILLGDWNNDIDNFNYGKGCYIYPHFKWYFLSQKNQSKNNLYVGLKPILKYMYLNSNNKSGVFKQPSVYSWLIGIDNCYSYGGMATFGDKVIFGHFFLEFYLGVGYRVNQHILNLTHYYSAWNGSIGSYERRSWDENKTDYTKNIAVQTGLNIGFDFK